MEELGIRLKPIMYKMDVRPLLKAILAQFFGPATGLVDLIVEYVASPVASSSQKAGSHICFTVISANHLSRSSRLIWVLKHLVLWLR